MGENGKMQEGGSQMGPEQGGQQPATGNGLFKFFIGAVIALVILGAFTLFQRRAQYHALAEETEVLAIPTVAVIHPTSEVPQEDLVLPGTLEAYVESPIYARTNGYLKMWYHDIGSHVPKGELLADIDTPEVDQQLFQARADLNTAQANANLSRITSTRYQDLIKTDGVSKQEVDNAVGDYEAKAATVKSAEANVRRLEELESFKHVYAPFSGVITRRNIDIGTLINAGNGGTQQELFTLAQTDPIRVYVNVPEMYSPSVRAGLGAFLELTQYPGQSFQGKVVRTAEAIDHNTRTLLTEVDVPNRSDQLFPGGYAQVHLQVKVAASRVQVPVNALLFRSEGLRAVVVDANHKAHLRALTIGRDFGTTLEVLHGLQADDWIVVNPPDSINEGENVRVKQVAQSPGMAQPDAAQTPASPPQPKATDANGAHGAKR
jgi:RND family efflux transporter MFP subunit